MYREFDKTQVIFAEEHFQIPPQDSLKAKTVWELVQEKSTIHDWLPANYNGINLELLLLRGEIVFPYRERMPTFEPANHTPPQIHGLRNSPALMFQFAVRNLTQDAAARLFRAPVPLRCNIVGVEMIIVDYRVDLSYHGTLSFTAGFSYTLPETENAI